MNSCLKKMILILLISVSISENLSSNEYSYSTLTVYKNLAVSGLSVYLGGVFLHLLSGGLLCESIFSGTQHKDSSKTFIWIGLSFFVVGFLADAVAGPILSIVAYNELKKPEYGLGVEKIEYDSGLWYGMSWVSLSFGIISFIISAAIARRNSVHGLITMAVLVGLSLLATYTFTGLCASIPLACLRL